MGVLLNESVWEIFEKVWTQRNEILHNSDSYTSREEAKSANQRLLLYKRLQKDLLSPNDYCLIGHPEIVVINWKTRKKKQQLKILDNAHKEWKKEYKLRKEGQRRLNELAGWEGLLKPLNEDIAEEPDTEKET